MVVCYNRNVYNKISVVVQIGMDLQISGCRCGMKGNMELEDHNGETEDKAKSEKKGGFIDIVVPVRQPSNLCLVHHEKEPPHC